MKRISLGIIYLSAFALLAGPAMAQESKQEKDKFEKAGNATEKGLEKAGEGAEKGLEGAGKGVGAAVEHSGRGVSTAAKATAGAMAKTGEAIADFFDGEEGNEDRVREVQRALQAKGYYSGQIDGIAGPQTRSGVREYQTDEGLEVTGQSTQGRQRSWVSISRLASGERTPAA
jgi:hypothetical protein